MTFETTWAIGCKQHIGCGIVWCGVQCIGTVKGSRGWKPNVFGNNAGNDRNLILLQAF